MCAAYGSKSDKASSADFDASEDVPARVGSEGATATYAGLLDKPSSVSEPIWRLTLILVKICSEQNLRGAISSSAWSEMA